MELLELEEPELVFGEGAHVCPRHGITEFGVVDAGVGSRREKIVLGRLVEKHSKSILS